VRVFASLRLITKEGQLRCENYHCFSSPDRGLYRSGLDFAASIVIFEELIGEFNP